MLTFKFLTIIFNLQIFKNSNLLFFTHLTKIQNLSPFLFSFAFYKNKSPVDDGFRVPSSVPSLMIERMGKVNSDPLNLESDESLDFEIPATILDREIIPESQSQSPDRNSSIYTVT